MTKPSTAREKMLFHARAQMLSKGFTATRVDEICDAANATKGSFYHHFASKEELALTLIEEHFRSLMLALESRPHTSPGEDTRTPTAQAQNGSANILAVLDHLVEIARGPLLENGSLLGSLALNLAETHPRIRAKIADCFEQLTALLENQLSEAIDNADSPGVATQILDPKAQSRLLVTILEGSQVLAKSAADNDPVKALLTYRDQLNVLLDLPH